MMINRKLADNQIKEKISTLRNLYHLVKNDIQEDLIVIFPSPPDSDGNGIKIGRDEIIQDIKEATAEHLITAHTNNAQVWALYYNNIYDSLKKLQ